MKTLWEFFWECNVILSPVLLVYYGMTGDVGRAAFFAGWLALSILQFIKAKAKK